MEGALCSERAQFIARQPARQENPNSLGWAVKHVERRHFFVRDMVESFEIEVPFVRTADNIADFFTKPMKTASQFRAMRKVIMNEP